jgi:hypothetical protein
MPDNVITTEFCKMRLKEVVDEYLLLLRSRKGVAAHKAFNDSVTRAERLGAECQRANAVDYPNLGHSLNIIRYWVEAWWVARTHRAKCSRHEACFGQAQGRIKNALEDVRESRVIVGYELYMLASALAGGSQLFSTRKPLELAIGEIFEPVEFTSDFIFEDGVKVRNRRPVDVTAGDLFAPVEFTVTAPLAEKLAA